MYRGNAFVPSALTVSVMEVLHSSMLNVQGEIIIPSVKIWLAMINHLFCVGIDDGGWGLEIVRN